MGRLSSDYSNLSSKVRHPCTQYRTYEPSPPSRVNQVFLPRVETLACVREVLSRLLAMHNSEKGTMKNYHDCCSIISTKCLEVLLSRWPTLELHFIKITFVSVQI